MQQWEKKEIRRFEIGGKCTQAWYQITVFPSAVGITVLGTDITERKKAEEAQRNMPLYGKILDNSGIAFQLLEPILDENGKVCDCRYLAVNAAFEALSGGYKTSEIIGRTMKELYPKAAKGEPYWLEECGEVLKSGKPLTAEHYNQDTDRWFKIQYFPHGEGQIASLFTDITRSKKAEEALKENQLNLNLAQQIAKVGSWVWNFNINELEWSDELYRILGLDPKEIPASLENWLLFIPIQEREQNRREIEKQKNNPLPHPNEQKILQRDGSLRWISVTTKNMVDDNGNIIKAYGTVQDITQRKKTEEALKESERLYKTIFDNSEDGFMLVEIIYDDRGKPINQKYLKINQASCKQTGIKEKDLIGKTLRQVLPNVEPSWFDIPDQVLKTGKPLHTENYNQDTNRYYDVYCFPFGEKTVGALFRDITERKSLEKQLQEKERLAAIGATAGMVGHDIRNPLQAITGDIYLLRDYLSGMPDRISVKHDVADSLDEIEKNVGYINKIVADLQDYSKAIRPELKELNLYDLVTSAFRGIEIPENVKPSLEIDPKISLKTDPTLFTRILTNLVINAIQAMPKGGDLSVVATKKQDTVVFSVADTGVGIPEDVKPKLFTPMMTTKAKGQGLGLAVVKRLVEALKGTISFESQEGKGTKFIINLPIL